MARCEEYPVCGHEPDDCAGDDTALIEAIYRQMRRADEYGEDY